jgi:transposase
VRTLAAIERKALVWESCPMGRLKEAHANNDKISAVRIGKAYLAGTAKTVWVPDAQTQERRDWFHAHRKAVKRPTQMRNRLRSYLSDQGVRLARGAPLAIGAGAPAQLRQRKDWSPRQWQVIEGMLMELRHADEQRDHWRSLIAQEVLADPLLLSIVRLCGVRERVAFALGALIGDIKRFAEPRKRVKYAGLNPAFDDSGEGQWSGGIAGHGRKDLRGLLIESARAILRSRHPRVQWGKKLLARKVGKIITPVGPNGLKQLKKPRLALRKETFGLLKRGRVYVLDPDKKLAPPAGNRERKNTFNEEKTGLTTYLCFVVENFWCPRSCPNPRFGVGR